MYHNYSNKMQRTKNWTLLDQGNGGTNGPTLAIFYKIATVSEPAGWVWDNP